MIYWMPSYHQCHQEHSPCLQDCLQLLLLFFIHRYIQRCCSSFRVFFTLPFRLGLVVELLTSQSGEALGDSLDAKLSSMPSGAFAVDSGLLATSSTEPCRFAFFLFCCCFFFFGSKCIMRKNTFLGIIGVTVSEIVLTVLDLCMYFYKRQSWKIQTG